MSDLQVWSRLEVGPAVIEKRRVRVPYAITDSEGTHTQLLTFRWAADVLDPDRDGALAAMIGAQVALNYGLFCEELVLHGPFDAHDRAFLTAMLHNTCTEIYVNKLRKPNAFLVDLDVPRVDAPETLCAKVIFADDLTSPTEPAWGSGTAILSSGGKDSLLTQGLCEELDLQPHALFANESGRHWFTALNAWRHLERTRPERTARVWTDCDRMYLFALRHLPFIRKDFERVRADDYPIRLWTVGVFLFGVLPMVRARKLGTVLIGDEWDSTVKDEYEGITHYGGYFDQSRFFDEALTRYTHAKGWNVVFCSVLRPLSEFLIQDILSARYPELFSTQLSCHAATVVGERVLPCAKCEKCRRIVGMLTALGRDPGAIGYTPDKVAACLDALSKKGAKQAADGEHLAALLVDSGHIPADSPFALSAKRHAGTERLRFDALRSPVNAVPATLRAPMWKLMLEHAKGALVYRGTAWVSLDPLQKGWTEQPHPFEHAPEHAPAEAWPEGHPVHMWGTLTWPQAQRRLRETDIALLPVGAIEQHGPHLPLDIDSWDAAYQAEQVALRCAEPRPLVLPLIPYGVSYHHDDFPGTLSIGPEALARLVYEVGIAAARNGIRKLVIINGHGGNSAALSFAAQQINRDAQIFTAVDTGETSDAEISALLETGGDAHAGEYETSTALATRPHLVFLEHACTESPTFDSRFLDFDSESAVEWHVRTSKISDSGILGDPMLATEAKGHAIWKITLDNMVELVEHLKSTPLDELHRPHSHGRDI